MILDLSKIKEDFNLKIKGVIHIGAHYGEEHSTYKQLDIKNNIYFEPLKTNFNILKNNVTDNSILYNFALGNENKTIEMFVDEANMGGSSSVLKPDLHLHQYPHIQFTKKETVEMKRLDDIKFDRNLFNFINIDVQGYELEVLKGAEDTLSNIDYIMSEVNRESLYENCVLIDELDLFLEKFNFKRVLTDWAGQTWGDAFYFKFKRL
jgi:FkbM family methyltransferase